MNDIKNYREKELKMYVSLCILLWIFLSKEYLMEAETGETIIALSNILNTALISGCIYLFVYVSDAIFSSGSKEKIIFLFGLINKPAYTIFEDIKKKNKDDRFTKEDAMETYKHVYANMPTVDKQSHLYQNEKWYKLYSNNRNVTMIFVSNRDYLLCRDMFFSTITVLFIYVLGIKLDFWGFDKTYIIFLGSMLVINYIATHIKAKRLVYNVIAYDLASRNN